MKLQKRQLYFSNEVENVLIETRICQVCLILRSRVLRDVYTLVTDTAR